MMPCQAWLLFLIEVSLEVHGEESRATAKGPDEKTGLREVPVLLGSGLGALFKGLQCWEHMYLMFL